MFEKNARGSRKFFRTFFLIILLTKFKKICILKTKTFVQWRAKRLQNDMELIRQELTALAEPDYQKFSSSLLPGTANILGVRLPVLRRIAARLSKGGWERWLSAFDVCQDSPPAFEETMLAGMVIVSAWMPLAERFTRIRSFIPRIDNWSVCDSFCTSLKEASAYPAEYWAFLQEFFQSKKEFAVRFALVMAADHFIIPDYLEQVLDKIDAFSHPAYYAQMAAAWALSICFVKFPDKTMPRLVASPLDDFTYNKALQKICESRRIDNPTRAQIRAMKRRAP